MYRAITDTDVEGKRLVVRADLNVPLDDGRVTDATRIDRFADGMKPFLDRGAALIILTHMGRPKGVADPALSALQVKDSLSSALGVEVAFALDCIGAQAIDAANALQNGGVLLCENLRFHAGETKNDDAFAAELAKLGDLFVNDAFSCAHRAHASTEAIAHHLPAYAGPMMMEELNALSAALEAPQSPSVAIVGGAKVSTKISVLKNLVEKLDHVIIGGGMANTFLFATGAPMGQSLHEADQAETAKDIMARATRAGCKVHLPTDVVVAQEFAAHAPHETVGAFSCPEDMMILDAGPKSVEAFETVLKTCHTILWNGPLGAFEIEPFDTATIQLAKAAAARTSTGATSVAGGGDTAAALNHAGVTDAFTYVSSAGGAFLEWLEGKTLPGIAALQDSK
ncbi:MAG: phosphoglycerate kinase [Pseudomonadota bacterium]